MTVAVLLDYPKFPHNVGTALRACALLGADHLFWTGDRVPAPDEWPEGARLPREERMRCYARTKMEHIADLGRITLLAVREFIETPLIPVCVEVSDTAENLRYFEHPEHALYVFGPEDGSVGRNLRAGCHRFVQIPNAIPPEDIDARTPYNLAAAVNLVLYDRLIKGVENALVASARAAVSVRLAT